MIKNYKSNNKKAGALQMSFLNFQKSNQPIRGSGVFVVAVWTEVGSKLTQIRH